MSEQEQERGDAAGETETERRRRWSAVVASGQTVSLTKDELADAALRRELPELLTAITGSGGAAGPQFPGYTLLGVIGHGGMSTVYLAQQDRLGRYVAVEVAAWGGAEQRARPRVIPEARALARVAHPNIVAIHDIVETAEAVAIALEWVDGMSLDALLRELPQQPSADDMVVVRQRLGVPPAAAEAIGDSVLRFFVRAMRDVARAVHRVHEAGLLHLDIKPSNVMVRRDGTPLLADFGVVREIDPAVSRTRSFAGTPIYSAPEQLRHDARGFVPQTDVYGLGITLYEVLARRQPLRELDLTGLVQTVARGKLPALSSWLPIAKDLETIVHKALQPDPRQRYDSAAAFAADLDAFLEGRPVAARPISRLRRLQRWTLLEPWKATLAALLLVTVPVVLFLGLQLMWNARHIEAGQRRDLLRQASELQQFAFRKQLVSSPDVSAIRDALERALALDPSDGSIACLATITADLDVRAVPAVLARFPAALERRLSLRLMAAMAEEGRPFFDDAEAAAAFRNGEPGDTNAPAPERVPWAPDRRSGGADEIAMGHLHHAAASREPDPLLQGLRAYLFSWISRGDRRDAVCATIQRQWPDSLDGLLWCCMALELDRPDRATELAREYLRKNPTSIPMWEYLVTQALRQQNQEQARARLEEVGQLQIASPRLDSLRALYEARDGRPEAARELLRTSKGALEYESRLICALGIDTTREAIERLLASPEPLNWWLIMFHREASRQGQHALAARLFARWKECFPYHRRLVPKELERRAEVRDWQGMAELAPYVSGPMGGQGDLRFCTALVSMRNWQDLAEHAAHWLGIATEADRAHASFFAGIAASRLGNWEQAIDHLAIATARPQPKVWYSTALLERAWVHVAPETPPTLRDPELAPLLLDRARAANAALQSPRRGAWILAVTAEVQFANGDVAGAIESARAALATREDPRTVPPVDWRRIVGAALQRYL